MQLFFCGISVFISNFQLKIIYDIFLYKHHSKSFSEEKTIGWNELIVKIIWWYIFNVKIFGNGFL